MYSFVRPASYVPNILLSTENAMLSKTNMASALMELRAQWEGELVIECYKKIPQRRGYSALRTDKREK